MHPTWSKVLAPPWRRQRIAGGIHPDPCKSASLRSRIMPMPLPPNLVLSLAQYHGTEMRPEVKVGDPVLKYQRLARDASGLGTSLHAPTSGIVTAIEPGAVPGPPFSRATCIHVQCDGEDNAIDLHPLADLDALMSSDIVARIADAGIVGMGGAGFPTAAKLRLAHARGVELLLVNAAECEPYISTDEALVRERAVQVVAGAELLRTACHAVHCVIAIEASKVDAIASLRKALAHSPIDLVILHDAYPTGSEKQLVQAVTGLEVPAGKYPLDLGIVVHNAGTAFATWRAVVEGKPCITRITTLTGSALQTPKNFEALIGTPIPFLLQLCGLDQSRHHATILGGSLMGLVLTNLDVAITKTSNCLIAATATEIPAREAERACIRCGKCAEVCPARLLPQQLYHFARVHDHDKLQEYGLPDCIECGACAWACPSHIPLVDYYLAAKQETGEIASKRAQSMHWQSRFQHHQYRLMQDREEAAARRARSLKVEPEPHADENESTFSRSQARTEIAAAVARAQAKRLAAKAADAADTGNPRSEK